jgi:hypothetical protein
MTNEEKAIMIAEQCKPCSGDFYSGIKQGVLLALNAEKTSMEKAKKYDELEEWLAKYMNEDFEGDLLDIGEYFVKHFGF